MRQELFEEWYGYRRPIDLRPTGGRRPFLAFGAASWTVSRGQDGTVTIATLYVVRRRFVARAVGIYAPLSHEVVISTEPAEQPDRVQVDLSVLPAPFQAGDRPCNVYASYGAKSAWSSRFHR